LWTSGVEVTGKDELHILEGIEVGQLSFHWASHVPQCASEEGSHGHYGELG